MIPRIITVAGSDSGGGAGIQADLKTIALLGGYGMSVVTALTAQNTQGISSVLEVPPEFVEQQMEVVLSDIGADALKTGMLVNSEIIKVVCQKIRKYRLRRVVVDPVMVAKNGTILLKPEAVETLQKELLPLAQIFIPNIPESEIIVGGKIKDLAGMKKAARIIKEMGAKSVLIKGGHLDGLPIDIFFDGQKFYEFSAARVSTPHTHGTGCTLAASIAVELAKGASVREAITKAKALISTAIKFSLPLGKGQGPVNPYPFVARERERYQVIQKLKKAFYILQEKKVGHLFPEVQSNIGYALPYPSGIEDVAAFPGRLIRWGRDIFKISDPEFGASQHIARIILTAVSFDPNIRSAMNLKLSEDLLQRARQIGLTVGHFDRRQEPPQVSQLEGSSLSWGVERVLTKMKKVPDLIYDRGGWGKESMIRILGHDPEEVVGKVLRLT
ncbi:MAG: bifunctional hydroxymethylpyrimidine kinase/phosphomethylpyrimidine kinase [Thermodesulfobacteriota bacterium]